MELCRLMILSCHDIEKVFNGLFIARFIDYNSQVDSLNYLLEYMPTFVKLHKITASIVIISDDCRLHF